MKHLDLDTRYAIKRALEERKSLTEIGRELGMAGSTISREIRSHLVYKRTGSLGHIFNDCKFRFHCNEENLCEGCFNRKCRSCKIHCCDLCDMYDKEECKRLENPPYVCNGCEKRGICSLEKRLYEPQKAQQEYMDVWVESHTGLSYSEEQIRRIDSIVSPLILKGQSIHHILTNHIEELMLSQSTLYRMLDDGLLTAKNIDLHRKVRFRVRKKSRSLKIDKKCRIGRTYADYEAYIAQNPNTAVVEMDSVEGKKGGKVLLTLHFVNTGFMLAFLRDYNDSASVIARMDRLYGILGERDFKKIFPLLLTDNGSEFSNPMKIEYDWQDSGELRTRVFYCDPTASWQKGSAERNHELIRYVIPKGTTMDDLCQEDIDLVMNHINSLCRESLGGKCPYDAFAFFYGKEILDRLDAEKIPADEVNLKPDLLKSRRCQNEQY